MKTEGLSLKMLAGGRWGWGAGGQFDSPCCFSKNSSCKQTVKSWFFVTLNVIWSHIFPENFIAIPQVVQKIWRLSLSILAIFNNFHQFLDFLTFPCYKETNDVSLKQMVSAFFYFQYTSNSCLTIEYTYINIRLVLPEIWSGTKLTPLIKLTSKSPALLRLKHKNCKLMSCGLFLLKSDPYLGATLDNILKCSCCDCACVKHKCPSSIIDEDRCSRFLVQNIIFIKER